jgi:hypothetical protein
LPQIVRLVLVGVMSGARSLADVEMLSADATRAARRLIGIKRRLADTTLRDVLVRLDPVALRPLLYRLIASAHQRRALVPSGVPFGVVAMDGKATAIADGYSPYAQRHTGENGVPYWLMRTITSALVSCAARPCIDVMPVPRHTNERGVCQKAFGELVRSSGHLFRLVTYDAGATCAANAAAVVKAGKDYLFAVKGDMQNLHTLICELLATKAVVTHAKRRVTNAVDVVTTLRLMHIRDNARAHRTHFWPSARTILQVDSWRVDAERAEVLDTRYFASSLMPDALTHAQWLDVVRRHWGVECVHNTLDTALAEDDKPFMPGSATGTLVVMMLRRVAYTALALFRAATRSETYAEEPWRRLLARMRDALIAMTDEALRDLRSRTAVRACG